MDHPGGNQPPAGMPFGHGAVFTILRSFVTRAPDDLGHDHRTNADEDMGDLPPLEPLGGSTSNVASEATNVDVPLPDSHPVDPAFATFAQQQTYEGSMPDLQSVSDSSDEGDDEEDEQDAAMPPLQTIPDDDNSEWSDEDEDLPPLEPVAGSRQTTVGGEDAPPLEPVVGDRRARVEDDHDEDRDRRHPSQRTGGQAGQQGQGNAPPFFAGIHNPGGPPPPGMLELFQTFMGGVGPPRAPGTAGNAPNDATRPTNAPNAPPQAAPHPQHHRQHHHHHPVPPVQFMFDMNVGGAGIAAPPGVVEMLFGLQGAQDPANPTPTTIGALQQLLERLATMGQAFGFPMEEKEDPERAKTLVKGLEEVPVGLIRRMEKVGGAPGGHVDEATGEVEAPSCAICWDTLLNQEGAQWARKEDAKESTQEQAAAPADDNGEEDIAALLPALADLSMNPSDQPMEGVTVETQQASGQPDLPPPEPLSSLDSLASTIASAVDPPTPTMDSNAGLDPSDPPIPAMDPPASSESKSKAEEDIDLDKIVCLPCAHVFHAACLIPWFTRPRQTTCPTCRFNVDPDNLTYVPTPMTMPTNAPAGPGPGPPQAPAAPAPATAAPGPQNAGERGDAPNLEGMPGQGFDAQLQNFLDENPQVMAEALGIAQGREPAPEQPPATAPPHATAPPPATAPGAGTPPRAPQTFEDLLRGAATGALPNGWGPGAAPPGGGGLPNGFTQLMGMFRVPLPMPPPGAPQPQWQPQAGPVPAPGQAGPTPAAAPPQQQQPQQQPQGPAPAPRTGQLPGTGIFTVDFTLFSENPFEGGGVRRQANLFANQIFGGGIPHAPPAPAPGAPANPAPGAAPRTAPLPAGGPRTLPRFPIIPGLPPFNLGPMPMPPPAPGGRTHGTNPQPNARPRERKTWTPPAAPGPTLRIRVEQREREVGMRCSDTSCGIGPSDEDPFPVFSDASMKQLSIRPLPKSTVAGTSVCSHTFHPACLVSAERVAGWGGEDKEEEEVEVACPSCRAVGCVPREEWEEGVRGLV